jgi:membrane-bound serine protease (ClpP class)
MSTLGIALLAMGAALAVVEAHVVSHGVVGTAAVIAIAAGLTISVDAAGAGLAAGLAVGLAAGAVGAVYLAFVVGRVLAVRRTPVRGGRAGLIGHCGEVRAVPAPVGRVLVDGELWRARTWEDEEHLSPGDPVVVERVDGLTLTVRRAEEWEVAP